MTKNVADLKFYGFVEFYRILKEKFEGFFIDISELESDTPYLTISQVPPSEIEEFEVVVEIYEPLIGLICATDSNLESVDLDKLKIRVDLNIHSVGIITFQINKDFFDDINFINGLKNIIGAIAPVRRKVDHTENARKWLEEEIKKKGIEQYLGAPAE